MKQGEHTSRAVEVSDTENISSTALWIAVRLTSAGVELALLNGVGWPGNIGRHGDSNCRSRDDGSNGRKVHDDCC